MDLFGIGEHDDRHDEVERQLRRLIEQVAQLTIDLGVTRTELRALALKVEGTVAVADVDPSMVAVNEGIKGARVKLAAAQESAEEGWARANEELTAAIESLQEEQRSLQEDREDAEMDES